MGVFLIRFIESFRTLEMISGRCPCLYDAASPVSFTKKKVELDGSDVWSGGEITSSSFEVPEIAALLILSQ